MSSNSGRRPVTPYAAVLLAVSLVVAAFAVPVEHTVTGGRTLEGWWLAMAGLAVLAAGMTWSTAWRTSGLWTAVLVLGMSAQLALTRPHWAMSLRVAPGTWDRPEHLLAVGILVLQGLIVAVAMLRRVGPIARGVAAELTLLRLLALGVIFLACAANVAVEYPDVFELGYRTQIHLRRLVAGGLIFATNVSTLWLIGSSLPGDSLATIRARLDGALTLPGQSGPARRWDARFPWVVAGTVLVTTLLVTFVVLDAAPHISDEMVFLWMAKVFGRGGFGVPAPAVPEAFEMYTVVVRDGMRYGVTYLGWPLALTPAMLLGVPWLFNPLLAALSVVVGHALVLRLVDRGTANVAALLLAASPWFLILSSVYQPHALSLLATLCTWLGIHIARERGSQVAALAAGLAAGVVFTMRPMDGVIVGGSGFLYAIAPLGIAAARWRVLPAFVLGCVGTGSVALAINYRLTGNPLSFPIMEYLDDLWGPGVNRIGFGPHVGRVWGVLDPIPGHGWRDVLLTLNQNFYALNYELLGWATGSLILVVIHLLWGKWSRLDVFWGVFFVGALGMYALYWGNGGADYGPRYWYSTMFPLVILSARGLWTLTGRLKAHVAIPDVSTRVGALFVVLVVSGVAVFGSWRAVAKYVDYRDYLPGLSELVDEGAFGTDGLVIVDAEGDTWYTALYLNDVVPGEHGPIFARDRGPTTTARLLEAYPGRTAYHLTGRFSSEGWSLSVEEIDREAAATAPEALPPAPASQ